MSRALAAALISCATASVAQASFLDVSFDSMPTIEPGVTDMVSLPNGVALGRAIDNNDRVRYSNVATNNGVMIDAIFTVIDAESRTGIGFSGGGTTVDSVFNTVDDAVINLSNAPLGQFGDTGAFDSETGTELIAGPSSQFQTTSARIRIDFVVTGTTTPIAPDVDIALTFFDIDGASSGPNRGRIDGLTLMDADSVFLTADTVLTSETNMDGDVTLQSSLGRVQSPVGELDRFSATAVWTDVNAVEFTWFFDWSANGTRGVNLNGRVDSIVPAPGAAALLGLAGLAGIRRRR